MDGNTRSEIHAGQRVSIVQKEDQRTGKLTEGVVQDILTKSPNHPHGIKVCYIADASMTVIVISCHMVKEWPRSVCTANPFSLYSFRA